MRATQKRKNVQQVPCSTLSKPIADIIIKNRTIKILAMLSSLMLRSDYNRKYLLGDINPFGNPPSQKIYCLLVAKKQKSNHVYRRREKMLRTDNVEEQIIDLKYLGKYMTQDGEVVKLLIVSIKEKGARPR
jgi:hypothetical protein